jgi:hypothetical protein
MRVCMSTHRLSINWWHLNKTKEHMVTRYISEIKAFHPKQSLSTLILDSLYNLQ